MILPQIVHLGIKVDIEIIIEIQYFTIEHCAQKLSYQCSFHLSRFFITFGNISLFGPKCPVFQYMAVLYLAELERTKWLVQRSKW